MFSDNKLTIGKDTKLTNKDFEFLNKYFPNLDTLIVDDDNKWYSSYDGCLYNKPGTILLYCPKGKKEVNINPLANDVDDIALNDCMITKIVFPENIIGFANCALNGCKMLKSITFLSKYIDTDFYGITEPCTALEKIIIPEDCNDYISINGAIYNKKKDTLICCPPGTKKLSLPDTVNKIGDNLGFQTPFTYNSLSVMFQFCKDLESIDVSGDNPYYYSKDGSLYDKKTNELLFGTIKGDGITFGSKILEESPKKEPDNKRPMPKIEINFDDLY